MDSMVTIIHYVIKIDRIGLVLTERDLLHQMDGDVQPAGAIFSGNYKFNQVGYIILSNLFSWCFQYIPTSAIPRIN